jgi:hypothetical protein
MPELSSRQMHVINRLDEKTMNHYRELVALLGPQDVASIRNMALDPISTYQEFVEWLNAVQFRATMIANNCKRIQEEL